MPPEMDEVKVWDRPASIVAELGKIDTDSNGFTVAVAPMSTLAPILSVISTYIKANPVEDGVKSKVALFAPANGTLPVGNHWYH